MGLNALSGAFECKSKKTWDDSNYYVVHWFSNNLDSLDGLNGFNRQPSKKVIFTVNRQKFQVISNLTISPDLNGLLARGGEGVLPYMGYIGMCRCEGYGFQAVYSRIGYINQNIWVSENRETARLG